MLLIRVRISLGWDSKRHLRRVRRFNDSHEASERDALPLIGEADAPGPAANDQHRRRWSCRHIAETLRSMSTRAAARLGAQPKLPMHIIRRGWAASLRPNFAFGNCSELRNGSTLRAKNPLNVK
jgi:hypothetical protein